MGYGEAIGTGLVEGLPFGEKLAAGAETYLPRWASGAGPEATGSYAENLARIKKRAAAVEEAYPKTTLGASLAPGMLLPMGEAGSAGKMALYGAGYGGLYGAGQGDDLEDAAVRGVVGAGFGAAGGALFGGANIARQRIIDAARRQGITLPRYAVTGPIGQALSKYTQGLPVIGPLMGTKAAGEEATKTAGEAATRLSQGTTPYEAGQRIGGALENFIGPVSDDAADRAYGYAAAQMDPKVTTPISDASVTLNNIRARHGSYGDTPTGKAIDLVQNAIDKFPTGLTYDALKELRSQVGKMKNWGSLRPEELPKAEVTALWSALGNDLDRASVNALKPGGDAAAHGNATRLYAAMQKNNENLVKLVGGETGGANPENIYQAIYRTAAEAPTSGKIDLLRQAKAAVLASNDPGAWDSIGQGIIGRMGIKPNAEGELAFNADKFGTDYSKIHPDAKDELFGKIGSGGLRDSLEDEALVAKQLRKLTPLQMGLGHGTAALGLYEAYQHRHEIMEHPGMIAAAALGIGYGRFMASPVTARASANLSRAYLNWVTQKTAGARQVLSNAAKGMSTAAAGQFGANIPGQYIENVLTGQ
jgi:hypothetical protein